MEHKCRTQVRESFFGSVAFADDYPLHAERVSNESALVLFDDNPDVVQDPHSYCQL